MSDFVTVVYRLAYHNDNHPNPVYDAWHKEQNMKIKLLTIWNVMVMNSPKKVVKNMI